MYLLYADESGNVRDSGQKHFVFGSVAVFERQGYWLSKKLDAIAERFDPADPASVELHGSPMHGGNRVWRRFPREQRRQAICDALQAMPRDAVVFAAAVNKASVSPKDPVLYAFEQLCSRFDYFLQRKHRAGETQRGIIVFDKSTYETNLQGLARDFRQIGHRWGIVRNLSEVPLFLDSRASRLVQLADLISYAVYRKYEFGDEMYFSLIEPRLDRQGGVVHGLYPRERQT